MFAKTHLTIGIISAATVSLLIPSFNKDGVLSLESIILMSGGAAVTSQLPDLDSVHSKVAQRIPIMKILSNTRFYLLLFIYSGLSLLYDYIQIEKGAGRNYYIYYSAVLCILLFSLGLMSKRLFTHRKMTHTLLFTAFVSLLLILPYIYLIHSQWYIMLAVGGIVGLVSHIAYDCLTKRGCPLFAPFSKRSISLLSLKSGKHDYIGVCLSLLFLLAAVCVVKYKEYIYYFYKSFL